MLLKERFQITRPLEEMEVAVVRCAGLYPDRISPTEEAVLRTALSLARVYRVRQDGREVGVGAFLEPFREQVSRRLGPVLLGKRPPPREELLPVLRDLKDTTLRARDQVLARLADKVTFEALDQEIRHKALVLVSGGGGGTGYVYLGVMSLLEEFGLRPALLVGTSIGAILSLFRSRLKRFDQTEMVSIVRNLSWKKMFRAASMESRYGLPAPLRLFLRAGIGRYFDLPPEQVEGRALRLNELSIPTIITVAGIRRGMLPHPVEFYEKLLGIGPRLFLDPGGVARRVQVAVGALAEFFTNPEMMVKLHLGADDDTADFDVLDAAGFSSALPGLIHYDVLRDDPHMRERLDAMMEKRGLFRLVDGGMVDNLPAKAAWRAVHKGRIGTRNAFILGLNGFASKLSTPLWLPMQRLAELNVAGNRPYAHLIADFKQTLSPLDLVPSVELISRALELGRRQIRDDIPFLCRMLSPLPAI